MTQNTARSRRVASRPPPPPGEPILWRTPTSMMPLHGVSARAPEEPASLRGQINRHRDAIVACVPGPVIALSVDWNADGSFGVVVRDRPGSREEACVRAVLAGERIDPAPGSSGTLLHVIEGDPHMRTLPDEEPGP